MPNLQPHSDEKYIQAIRSGDDRLIGEFYNYAFLIARSVVFRECGLNDDDQFKDIYQDSFFRFFGNVKKENFKLTSQLTTFLIGICKNQAREKVRLLNRQTLTGKNEDLADEYTPFNKFVDRYENLDERKKRLIETELDKMKVNSGDCYALLDLSFRSDFSNQEIAQKLNRGIDVVKTQKSRCLGYLKKAIFNRLNYE